MVFSAQHLVTKDLVNVTFTDFWGLLVPLNPTNAITLLGPLEFYFENIPDASGMFVTHGRLSSFDFPVIILADYGTPLGFFIDGQAANPKEVHRILDTQAICLGQHGGTNDYSWVFLCSSTASDHVSMTPKRAPFRSFCTLEDSGVILGRSLTSTVRRGRRIASHRPMAVKITVRTTPYVDPPTVQMMDPHVNVAQVTESYHEPLYSYDILDTIPSGSLVDYVDNFGGPIPESTAKKIIRSILSGVQHLHSSGFRGNRLNPQNILIVGDDPPTPIVSDFISNLYDVGLPGDGQALGSVALFLFTREVPSFHLDIMPLIDIVPDLHISEDGRSFIGELLDTQLSICDAHMHAWFTCGDEDEGNSLED